MARFKVGDRPGWMQAGTPALPGEKRRRLVAFRRMTFLNRGELTPPATSAMDVLARVGRQPLNAGGDACGPREKRCRLVAVRRMTFRQRGQGGAAARSEMGALARIGKQQLNSNADVCMFFLFLSFQPPVRDGDPMACEVQTSFRRGTAFPGSAGVPACMLLLCYLRTLWE